eukprot:scaffold22827_cov15-Tisochrysis_lutea.AAC.1
MAALLDLLVTSMYKAFLRLGLLAIQAMVRISYSFRSNCALIVASIGPHFLLALAHVHINVGWGMVGKEIQFIPDSPLQKSDVLPDGANSEESKESKVALGVGIGVGVGGGLLLIALLAWLAVVRKRRNRGAALKNDS